MDTHNVILGCYDAAEEAYKAGDKKQAKLWIQCQEKSVYTIGMVMMEDAISNNDANEYLQWSSIVQTKFKVADKDPATQALFTAIKNDPSQLGIYSDVIRENMLDIFELKTVEELEEAHVTAWIAAVIDGDAQYKAHIDEQIQADIDRNVQTEKSGSSLPWGEAPAAPVE